MMDLIISQLNLKYAEFQNAIKEKEFFGSYKAIYEYFEIIRVQNEIQKAIEQDRLEVEEKRVKVGEDKSIGDKEKRKIIARINDYSISSCYDKINSKVYVPIKAYRESIAPASKEFRAGQAITAPKGGNKIGAEILAELFYAAIIGNVEAFKVFWIQITYRFGLDNFSHYMETLHTILVRKMLELSPTKDEKITSNKIHIIIDKKIGIYQEGKEELAYEIEWNCKRLKLIQRLIEKDNCSLAELNKATRQTDKVTMKSVPEINELFTTKLNLEDDLILSIPTGGYSINRDVYDVAIKR